MTFFKDCQLVPYFVLFFAILYSTVCPEKMAILQNPISMLLMILITGYAIINEQYHFAIILLATTVYIANRYQMDMCSALLKVNEKFEHFDPKSESTIN